MPGDGKALERLIEVLERALTSNMNVKVEVRKRVRDRTTNRLREHDVVITFFQGHHSTIMAIECRDLSRPVGVSQVEAFYKKCVDTGIDVKVIVSAEGFYDTARMKAEFLGVRCLSLKEIESLNWLLISGIRCHERMIIHSEWTLLPEDASFRKIEDLMLLDSDGHIIDESILTYNASEAAEKYIQRNLSEMAWSLTPKYEVKTIHANFACENLVLQEKTTCRTTRIREAFAKITFSVMYFVAPLKLVNYTNANKGLITEAAVAEIKMNDIAGDIVMVRNKDNTKSVFFVKNNKAM